MKKKEILDVVIRLYDVRVADNSVEAVDQAILIFLYVRIKQRPKRKDKN